MNFWYQSTWSIAAVILMPLSLLFRLIASWKRKNRSNQPYPVPVIVVGNITVGGTGKTPTIIWLANFLENNGFRVGIVSRGYGAAPSQEYPIEVVATDTAAEVGDEPALIRNKTNAHIIIDPNRHRAVQTFCQRKMDKPDIIISDDGMQHYRMYRDIEILMIDSLRGFGNRQLLPSGPLREPVSRLSEVDFVLAKQTGQHVPVKNIQYASVCKKLPINNLSSVLSPQPIRLMTAIGNADSFAQTVRELGFNIVEQQVFRDHAIIPESIINELGLPVLVTEKDFIKLSEPGAHIFYVPFEIDYGASFKETLLNRIKGIVHEKNSTHSGTF